MAILAEVLPEIAGAELVLPDLRQNVPLLGSDDKALELPEEDDPRRRRQRPSDLHFAPPGELERDAALHPP